MLMDGYICILYDIYVGYKTPVMPISEKLGYKYDNDEIVISTGISGALTYRF